MDRLVRLTHTTIVEDEAYILVGLFVAEVLGLPLPLRFQAAEAHDPLGSDLNIFSSVKQGENATIKLCPRQTRN